MRKSAKHPNVAMSHGGFTQNFGAVDNRVFGVVRLFLVHSRVSERFVRGTASI